MWFEVDFMLVECSASADCRKHLLPVHGAGTVRMAGARPAPEPSLAQPGAGSAPLLCLRRDPVGRAGRNAVSLHAGELHHTLKPSRSEIITLQIKINMFILVEKTLLTEKVNFHMSR